jgi:hypothetical protein
MTANDAARAGLPAIGLVKSRMFCKNISFRLGFLRIIFLPLEKGPLSIKTAETAKCAKS